MKLLADECCDANLVHALRQAGYDIKFAAKTHREIFLTMRMSPFLIR